MKIKLDKIYKNCLSCKKEIAVKDVAKMSMDCLKLLYNQGTILKVVESKIGENDWNTLVTSTLGTFLSSLYATVELSENPEEAIKFGNDIGAKAVLVSKGK